MEQELIQEKVNVVVEDKKPHLGDQTALVAATRFQLRTSYILGTRFDNIDGTLARRIISHYVEKNTEPRARKIFFTNVHSVCVSLKDWITQHCINVGDLVLADGSGMKLGGLISNNPITENLNGTDFTPTVLRLAQLRGWSVYFFGAKQEIVEACCARVRLLYPNLRIAGYRNGYFKPDDEEGIINEINSVQPDILLVALGTPIQETWLTRYAYRLNVKVCMAVGGLFDFLSMTRKRAPMWMRRIGLEWIYRFFSDPKTKWRRVVIEIPVFMSLLVVKRFLPQKIQRSLRKVIFS